MNTAIDDGGSIEATRRKIEEIKRNSSKVFDSVVYKFMQAVHFETINEMNSMGILDTGALMSSTRVERNGKIAKYDNSLSQTESNWQIISGGGGIYNYKNKSEVDYAKAVHDGYATANGRWIPGRPYLDSSWAKMEGQWQNHLSNYLKWIEETWSKDQPSAITEFRLPLMIDGENIG